MKCKLNIPEACFNCPYPECTATNMPTRKETEILKILGGEEDQNDLSKKIRDSEYNKKRRARKRSREYYQLHKEELREKRREYFREYARKRRANGTVHAMA